MTTEFEYSSDSKPMQIQVCTIIVFMNLSSTAEKLPWAVSCIELELCNAKLLLSESLSMNYDYAPFSSTILNFYNKAQVSVEAQ